MTSQLSMEDSEEDRSIQIKSYEMRGCDWHDKVPIYQV
jgi:hypothetical protein